MPLVLLLAVPARAARAAATQAAPQRLPLSWTCLMHPEIVEAEKGSCPICKMTLVPVRLDSIFGCPVHSVVHARTPGRCPICRRELVPVTVAVTWTCADHPEVDKLDRGVCADGSPMVEQFTPRAHGNHNPQHGGAFFMAPDNWHHLEGTLPSEGLFRVYLYDDYTKPLPPADVRAARGSVTPQGGAAVRLTPAPDGRYLEARSDSLTLAAGLTVTIAIKPGAPEYHFDFTFPELSNDRAASALAASAAVDPSQIPVEIPDDSRAILTMLRTRDKQIAEIIARGAFADLYVPAFQAKDLALALDFHLRELPARTRGHTAPAIKHLVQSAWLLDADGDLGDRAQIVEAYATFTQAIADIERAFAPPPR